MGITPSLEDRILWIDNTSAIATATAFETKPKSRHYALRWFRVRDAAKCIMFCPTTLQKADGLTKNACSVPQRRLLLHHVDNRCCDVYDESEDETSDEDMD